MAPKLPHPLTAQPGIQADLHLLLGGPPPGAGTCLPLGLGPSRPQHNFRESSLSGRVTQVERKRWGRLGWTGAATWRWRPKCRWGWWRGGQHSRPVLTRVLAGPCFWSKLRVADLGQEGSSWVLCPPCPPKPAHSGTRKLGPVPRAASGQLASALFLEALGAARSCHPNPAAGKPFLMSPRTSHTAVNFCERTLCAGRWARSWGREVVVEARPGFEELRV